MGLLSKSEVHRAAHQERQAATQAGADAVVHRWDFAFTEASVLLVGPFNGMIEAHPDYQRVIFPTLQIN